MLVVDSTSFWSSLSLIFNCAEYEFGSKPVSDCTCDDLGVLPNISSNREIPVAE